VSDPQQSWNQPGPQQPWGQQPPPPWGPQQQGPYQQAPHQQGQPSWGSPARTSGGSTPLLVLGLVTAVLAAVGAFLPSVVYPDGVGSYGPLFQSAGDYTYFQAPGLLLLVGAALAAAGALVQRARAGVGVGLLLVGAGMVGHLGLSQLVGRLQAALDSQTTSTAVGGVLLMLAGCTAVAAAVVGLVRLSRLR